jgi:hypothetical protein
VGILRLQRCPCPAAHVTRPIRFETTSGPGRRRWPMAESSGGWWERFDPYDSPSVTQNISCPANSRRHGNRQENIHQHDFHPTASCNELLCLGPPDYISGILTDATTAPVPPLLPPAPPHAASAPDTSASRHRLARCFTSCAVTALANVCRFPVFDQMLLMCSPDAHQYPSR